MHSHYRGKRLYLSTTVAGWSSFDGDIQNMFRWQLYSVRHGMKFYARNTMRICLLAHEGCEFSVHCVSLSLYLPVFTSNATRTTPPEFRQPNRDLEFTLTGKLDLWGHEVSAGQTLAFLHTNPAREHSSLSTLSTETSDRTPEDC